MRRAIKENIEETFGDMIRTDKSRYDLWMKECGLIYVSLMLNF